MLMEMRWRAPPDLDDSEPATHASNASHVHKASHDAPPADAAGTTPERATREKKILFLDGVRGLAAMLVVAHHSRYLHDIDVGANAVDTFFVLSAFLLTLLFENKARGLFDRRASYRAWAITLVDYMVRRFLRVYPLFAVIAVLVSFLNADAQLWLFSSDHYYKDYDLLKTLRFEPGHRHHVFWTLPIEIGYYFLIPPLVVAVINLGSDWWIIGMPGYLLVFYAGLATDRSNHRELMPHIPTFLCGSLAAIVFAKVEYWIAKHDFQILTIHRRLLCVVQVAVVIAVVGICVNHQVLDPEDVALGKRRPVVSPPFISFHVSLVIVVELLVPGPLSLVLEWSVLRHAGKVSYSMYLLHTWVVLSAPVNRLSYYNRFCVIWTLVFALSSLSYRYIEQPCQALAASISEKLKRLDMAHVRR